MPVLADNLVELDLFVVLAAWRKTTRMFCAVTGRLSNEAGNSRGAPRVEAEEGNVVAGLGSLSERPDEGKEERDGHKGGRGGGGDDPDGSSETTCHTRSPTTVRYCMGDCLATIVLVVLVNGRCLWRQGVTNTCARHSYRNILSTSRSCFTFGGSSISSTATSKSNTNTRRVQRP